MRVLHIVDHSLPVHRGYTVRTRAILRQHHRLGWETVLVTSPEHPEGVGLAGRLRIGSSTAHAGIRDGSRETG